MFKQPSNQHSNKQPSSKQLHHPHHSASLINQTVLSHKTSAQSISNRYVYFAMLPLLAVVILGQVSFVPWPLTLFWFGVWLVLFWRVRQGQLAALATYWQMTFLILSLLLIWAQFGRLWGVEPGVAFLSTCLFAKCLESKTARDLIVVFNFGLFVCASLFLHSQAMWLAALVLVGLISGFIGLFRIQTYQFVTQGLLIRSLKQDALHVLKSVSIALPFFVLLFMFFPRLPPVWSIAIPENKAVTGLSDTMSPGDIAQLSQSSALAFRIVGDMTQLPQRTDLYWRAMVLDRYDGTTWRSHELNQTPQSIPQTKLQGFAYEYLPAQAGPKWITGLEYSVPLNSRYALRRDGSIQPLQLKQDSQPIALFKLQHPYFLQQASSNLELQLNREFVRQSDPKAQALAAQLWQRSAKNPDIYVQLVLQWYKQHQFVYTLSPGILTYNRIDQFLFEQRRGFCEHYASSFVMLMRYVGIPARVTVGYQGGQLAPDAKSWEVRQLDAHAWSEVWIDGQWQRIDPTAIIAPQRIDDGMQNYASINSSLRGDHSALRIQSYEWLKNARIWSDYLSYQWQSKVVGYDVDAQKNWLQKLGVKNTYYAVLIIFIGFLCLGIGFFLWHLYQQHQQVSPLQRQFLQLNRKLPIALQRQPAETIQHWMQRLHSQNGNEDFLEISQLYTQLYYAEAGNNKVIFQQLRRLLKDCANALD